jgi:glycosyltransferase involved in cell wall biosynthesis
MNGKPLDFSIVIPTYNRPERLANCLAAIAQQDYSPEFFEVIVVDDGSPTPLDEVVQPFRDRLQVTLLRQDNAGPARARNAGAACARGQFLVFTDDDCTPAITWLSALAVARDAHPQSLIGGQTLNALPNNLFSTASQLLIDYLYSYYNQAAATATFFASNNFAMPTEPFRAVGGFDTRFPLAAGEDREFCDRWRYHGYDLIYAPTVQLYHAHHLDLARFWRQHFNYGRGAFCFHQIRAQRTTQSIQVEPLTFYIRLLTFPFVRTDWPIALPLSGLLLLSQVANVAGFFWERSRSQSLSQHPLVVDSGN